MGSKLCVKFQRAALKFHTEFRAHTPQNIHFADFYFCVWFTISLNCDVICRSETGPRAAVCVWSPCISYLSPVLFCEHRFGQSRHIYQDCSQLKQNFSFCCLGLGCICCDSQVTKTIKVSKGLTVLEVLAWRTTATVLDCVFGSLILCVKVSFSVAKLAA